MILKEEILEETLEIIRYIKSQKLLQEEDRDYGKLEQMVDTIRQKERKDTYYYTYWIYAIMAGLMFIGVIVMAVIQIMYNPLSQSLMVFVNIGQSGLKNFLAANQFYRAWVIDTQIAIKNDTSANQFESFLIVYVMKIVQQSFKDLQNSPRLQTLFKQFT